MLATIAVTSLADNLNVDGQVTLREAIRAAELDISVDGSTAGNGADVLQFAPGLSGEVELLLAGDITNGRSAFSIASDVTIRGTTGGLTIERSQLGPEMRLFRVAPTGRLTVEWLTLAGGIVRGDTGQLPNVSGGDAEGGAIFNEGTVRIIASTLAGNSVHGGDAAGEGVGGTASGGAIHNSGGDVLILNSTLSGNAAHSGAGGNISSFGGGLYSRNGNLEIYNGTITNNVAVAGRSVCIIAVDGAATVEVHSSIIAQADAPQTLVDFLASPDTDGVLTVTGANNLIRRQNDYESIAISSEDPRLGPLAENGGPTPTHALAENSPAINQGSNLLDAMADQRGGSHDRVRGGQADIGAFELQNVNEPGIRGDYNGNGVVDAADYVIWRKTLGSNVPPSTGADDDGDGLVELQEYGVWRNNFGNRPEPSQFTLGMAAIQQSAARASLESVGFVASDGVLDAPSGVWTEARTNREAARNSCIAPAASQSPSALLALAADKFFESLENGDLSFSSKNSRPTAFEIELKYSTGVETEIPPLTRQCIP